MVAAALRPTDIPALSDLTKSLVEGRDVSGDDLIATLKAHHPGMRGVEAPRVHAIMRAAVENGQLAPEQLVEISEMATNGLSHVTGPDALVKKSDLQTIAILAGQLLPEARRSYFDRESRNLAQYNLTEGKDS